MHCRILLSFVANAAIMISTLIIALADNATIVMACAVTAFILATTSTCVSIRTQQKQGTYGSLMPIVWAIQCVLSWVSLGCMLSPTKLTNLSPLYWTTFAVSILFGITRGHQEISYHTWCAQQQSISHSSVNTQQNMPDVYVAI